MRRFSAAVVPNANCRLDRLTTTAQNPRKSQYPGRDSNPHSRIWPGDFKSPVSANSTTWARGRQSTTIERRYAADELRPEIDAVWISRVRRPRQNHN